jgi:hypothetical protein
VFWAVYCLDKTIALRCGRPAVIQDEDVSCPFPRGVQVSQGQDVGAGVAAGPGQEEFDFFLCFTRLARLCGVVARRLYSAAALSSPIAPLREIADQMLQQVKAWKQSIPAAIRPGRQLGRMGLADRASQTQLLVLHSSYHYVLCAIHRRFSHMFVQDVSESSYPEGPGAQEEHIQAARSMALLTKYLDIESFTPGWYVLGALPLSSIERKTSRPAGEINSGFSVFPGSCSTIP